MKTKDNGDQNTQLTDNNITEDIDINNTKAFTNANRYKPIVQWLKNNNIQADIDPDTIDTTGFFDEIALSLGNNYDTLKFVSNQIKYNQNKGYDNVKLTLSKKTQKEINTITTFCEEMHEYSFVSRYFYHKEDKVIRLTLQTAPKIKHFFNGIWMEWFALMKVLKLFKDHHIDAACMRSLKVTFPNGISNELDIFILINNKIPLCIECKTGEFRKDIDKYLTLRKRLNISKNNFLICVFGLENKYSQGMSSMYDLTFANENSFIPYIKSLIDFA